MQRSEIQVRLLEAAKQVFLSVGYQASVDEIAQRAGIAKQTLYNHFKSKERLFVAVIRQAAAPSAESLDAPGLALRERLIRFGHTLRSYAFSSEGLALYRLIVAEAHRIPDDAELLWAAGPGAVHEQLAQVLRAADAAGELRVPAPEFAADMLLSMLLTFDRLRPLYGLPTLDGDPATRTEHIVSLFLRAFEPASTDTTVARSEGGLPARRCGASTDDQV